MSRPVFSQTVPCVSDCFTYTRGDAGWLAGSSHTYQVYTDFSGEAHSAQTLLFFFSGFTSKGSIFVTQLIAFPEKILVDRGKDIKESMLSTLDQRVRRAQLQQTLRKRQFYEIMVGTVSTTVSYIVIFVSILTLCVKYYIDEVDYNFLQLSDGNLTPYYFIEELFTASGSQYLQ